MEIKRSLTPKLERGFRAAQHDLRPQRSYVAYPGTERYRLGEGVEAIAVDAVAHELLAAL
ncbi:MAG: hypothetical protein ACRD07_06855 [Acidimicrobiales bacterium]